MDILLGAAQIGGWSPRAEVVPRPAAKPRHLGERKERQVQSGVGVGVSGCMYVRKRLRQTGRKRRKNRRETTKEKRENRSEKKRQPFLCLPWATADEGKKWNRHDGGEEEEIGGWKGKRRGRREEEREGGKGNEGRKEGTEGENVLRDNRGREGRGKMERAGSKEETTRKKGRDRERGKKRKERRC